MSNDTTYIVIPAHNEEKSVGAVVAGVAALPHVSVIVVDDASSDSTADEARRSGAEVISLCCQLGAWRATQAGIRRALAMGAERLVTVDADGQHTTKSVSSLLEQAAREESDVLIGADLDRGSVLRRVAWYLHRKLSGLVLRDLTSGLRVYNARALRVLASRSATSFLYQDVGVLLLLQQNGMSIMETQVTMNKRTNGHSRIFGTWISVLRYMLYTMIIGITKRNR